MWLKGGWTHQCWCHDGCWYDVAPVCRVEVYQEMLASKGIFVRRVNIDYNKLHTDVHEVSKFACEIVQVRSILGD